MSEIIKLTLNELVAGIKKKKFSSHEVTKDFVNRCIKSKKLNSFITDNFDNALKISKKFEIKSNQNKQLPGIPFAVKDLFCTKGIKTTAGSKILNNFIPPGRKQVFLEM
jgi:aspartyl-tRNA(Asn)/glutamyl-tRNA(Gln) amidotransferase subunit A